MILLLETNDGMKLKIPINIKNPKIPFLKVFTLIS